MILQEILQISGNLPSKLALMYYDYDSSSLKEINESSVSLALYPYESTVRRFFLCGDFIQDKTCSISCSVNSTMAYEVKILAGIKEPSIVDFNGAVSTVQVDQTTCEFAYLNAIPVDIFIESFTRSEYSVSLEIKLYVDL